MKRWIPRLLLFGGATALLVYLWSRLNQDLDEDELEDEIPIEFDVPLAGEGPAAPDASEVVGAAGADTGLGPGADLRAASAEDGAPPDQAAAEPAEDTGTASGADFSAASAAGEPLDAAAGEAAGAAGDAPDDLTLIRGIGPVYQQRLANLGITTFRQLAGADRAQLEHEGFDRLGVDLDGWIEQARALAAGEAG